MPQYPRTDMTSFSTSDVSKLVSGIFDSILKRISDVTDLSDQNVESLRNYTLTNIIDTSIPHELQESLDITEPSNITIDPLLNAQMPTPPLDSEYPLPVPGIDTADHDFPDDSELAYTDITVPVLKSLNISIPSFVDQVVPGPTETIPEIDFDPISATTIDTGALAPEDALTQAIKAKLLSNIQNGGTMLNTTVEADLWNRELERSEQQLQDSLDKLTQQWAKLGWTLPDGLLLGSYQSLLNEYTNKRLTTSRDISVKQAEMEHDGMFKSIDSGISLEKVLFDNLNDYAKRVFEASKTTSDQVVQIYNSRIQLYNTSLEAFKTDVEVYKAKLQAEAVRVQTYTSLIEAKKAIIGMDAAQVDLYKSQIEAENQKIDIFKSKVAIVSQKYEAERIKAETYRAKVQAYISEVQAITQKYTTEVEAFKAFVFAFNASSENQLKFKELVQRGDISELEARMKAWEIEMQAEIEENKLKLQALQTTAQIESNVAAGAFSALHASAVAQFTGQDQLNYNVAS